ncbi:putative uncharacterized protein [Aliivibrio wodanis]|uniref:Knr4/Smi1-like domain-containing protein n=1 Tax=Aliivibrio wodanis TaxID=80852 RepID=A0A090IBI1_9GAMM|nr:putative uncharacterized protein [Aliivibrio wodanis]
MYDNEIINCGKSLSKDELINIEVLIGQKMHSSLFVHFLKYNGGNPSSRNTFDGGGLIELQVHSFLYVLEGKEEGLNFEDTVLSIINNKKLIPIDMLPFASNEGGDYFCICSRGKIYFCSMDFSDEYGNVTMISKSMKDFINEMYELDW